MLSALRGRLDYAAMATTSRRIVGLIPTRAQHILVFVGRLSASCHLQPSTSRSPSIYLTREGITAFASAAAMLIRTTGALSRP